MLGTKHLELHFKYVQVNDNWFSGHKNRCADLHGIRVKDKTQAGLSTNIITRMDETT